MSYADLGSAFKFYFSGAKWFSLIKMKIPESVPKTLLSWLFLSGETPSSKQLYMLVTNQSLWWAWKLQEGPLCEWFPHDNSSSASPDSDFLPMFLLLLIFFLYVVTCCFHCCNYTFWSPERIYLDSVLLCVMSHPHGTTQENSSELSFQMD